MNGDEAVVLAQMMGMGYVHKVYGTAWATDPPSCAVRDIDIPIEEVIRLAEAGA